MEKEFLSEYSVLGEIGKGAYASVYKCRSKLDGKIYAVKQIKIDKISVPEIDILGHRIITDHIMGYKEIFFGTENVYIVLPLMDTDLGNYIYALNLTRDQKIELMYQIAFSIECLHKQYYHCDLKPDNILMKNGNAVLSDFSLAYSKDIPDYDAICLTNTYRPPELLFHKRRVEDKYRSMVENYTFLTEFNDLWAYGCIVFFILTKRQFIMNESEIFGYLDDPDKYLSYFINDFEFFSFLKKLLDPRKSQRYQSASDILQDPIFMGKREIVCGKIDFYKKFKKIDNKVLSSIFYFILEISLQLNSRIQTFIFAIDLFARTLDEDISPKYYQAWAVCCYWIATELYENSFHFYDTNTGSYGVKQAKLLCDNAFTEKELIIIRNQILGETRDNIGSKTLYDYSRDLLNLKDIVKIILNIDDDSEFLYPIDSLKKSNYEFIYGNEYHNIKDDLKNQDIQMDNINVYKMRILFPNWR